MRDIGLYRQILGLTSPWSVADVELKVDTQVVNIWLEHPAEPQFAVVGPGGETNRFRCDVLGAAAV